MDWVETLPSQCPPSDAVSPEGFYYRAVSADCSEQDFVPYSRLYPNKQYKGVMACKSRALSIFAKLDDCVDAIKLPSLQKLGQTNIAKLTLTGKDGLVKKERGNGSHYSWWRTSDFDITSVAPLILLVYENSYNHR